MTSLKGDFVEVVIPPLPGQYTYAIPSETKVDIDMGYRVEVPLGGRTAVGFVVARRQDAPTSNSTKEFKIKSVIQTKDQHACFNTEQLRFFEWIADYHGESIGQVLDAAVPNFAPRKFDKILKLKDRSLPPPKGKLQREIVKVIDEWGGTSPLSSLSSRFRSVSAAIKSLAEKNYIEIIEEEILDQHVDRSSAPSWAAKNLELSPAQNDAVEKIAAAAISKSFSTFLLHGITGSGKTEVYMEAIRRTAERGLGALVLVPEIALTPQLIDRFKARLGPEIAVLHSGLNKRTRWDSWRALLEKRNFIAIGARSGVFAPVPNLGLIIIDEEHDASYKQSEGLRYNARDLAVVRAKMQNCAVVLGSATPSLETFYNAKLKRYHYLSLPTRPGASKTPDFEVVDLNRVKPYDMPSKNISPRLKSAIGDALSREEQIFILYNRRGFASYLQCEACEAVVPCPHCSVTLTYHQNTNSLVCHYCSLASVPSQFCSVCPPKSPGKLIQRGAGTEKVFDELKTLFPEAGIDRLDRDSVDNIESYRAILDKVRSGETQILVGTQMIAKGHDLPGVTLVGVVDCDIGLHMPDFRAGERVFQLLTQASGRAGRGEKAGLVILQTRVPKHPSIVCTVNKNFSAYAEQELVNREALGYPPFGRILRILAISPTEAMPMSVLTMIRKRIEKLTLERDGAFRILGPCPAPLQKLKNNYRCHLIIKSKSPAVLNSIVRTLRLEVKTTPKIRIVYDLDPQEML